MGIRLARCIDARGLDGRKGIDSKKEGVSFFLVIPSSLSSRQIDQREHTVHFLHLVQKVSEKRSLVSIIVLVHAGLVSAVVERKLGTFDEGY